MANSFNQLGASFARLSSLERRFIIVVLVLIFIVINLIFVLPHFSDLGKIDNRFADAYSKQQRYQKEIAQIPFYEGNIKKWEGEGASVPQEDQSVSFLTAIQSQAAQSGIGIVANNRQPTRTNQFTVDMAQALTTQSGEAQLVDFLYNLGAGGSMIRARALSIRPDQPRTGLSATMTLVASFQKKATTRAATPATRASTPASRSPTSPATQPAGKPTTPSKPVPSTSAPVNTNRPVGSLPTTKPLTPPSK